MTGAKKKQNLKRGAAGKCRKKWGEGEGEAGVKVRVGGEETGKRGKNSQEPFRETIS